MIESPPQPVSPVVESPSVTLTEDDDVAFSLRLCREINRIYSEYAAGELAASEKAQAGLSMTETMLSTLAATVVDGMPAMRIRVAASQVREMNHVLFGDSGAAGRPSLASGESGLLMPVRLPDGSGARPLMAGPSVAGSATWDRFWGRRALLTRVLMGTVGCAVAAVCVDVPFTVMALFPGQAIPIGSGFLGSGVVVYGTLRKCSAQQLPVTGPV